MVRLIQWPHRSGFEFYWDLRVSISGLNTDVFIFINPPYIYNVNDRHLPPVSTSLWWKFLLEKNIDYGTIKCQMALALDVSGMYIAKVTEYRSGNTNTNICILSNNRALMLRTSLVSIADSDCVCQWLFPSAFALTWLNSAKQVTETNKPILCCGTFMCEYGKGVWWLHKVHTITHCCGTTAKIGFESRLRQTKF